MSSSSETWTSKRLSSRFSPRFGVCQAQPSRLQHAVDAVGEQDVDLVVLVPAAALQFGESDTPQSAGAGGGRCVRQATAATAAGGGGAEPVPLGGGLGERPGLAEAVVGRLVEPGVERGARQRVRRPSPRPRGRPRSRRCSGPRGPR